MLTFDLSRDGPCDLDELKGIDLVLKVSNEAEMKVR